MIEIAKNSKIYNYLMECLNNNSWGWDTDAFELIFNDIDKNFELRITSECNSYKIYIRENGRYIFSSSDFFIALSLEKKIKELFNKKQQERYEEVFQKEMNIREKEIKYLESKI